MEKLISDRPMLGDYGMIPANTPFETTDEIAKELLENGRARRVNPKITYKTKVVTPVAPEVQAEATPFRHSDMHHEEQKELAPTGDQMFPQADVPERGTADRSGRGSRR